MTQGHQTSGRRCPINGPVSTEKKCIYIYRRVNSFDTAIVIRGIEYAHFHRSRR